MIISGKELSARLKAVMAEKMPALKEKYGRVPCLAVILVGENPASQSYVRGKIKACQVVGMDSMLVAMPSTVSEKELLDKIEELNRDDSVDGILVQLPLPGQIAESKVIDAISVDKDVDGFHPSNVAKLWLGEPCTLPCTPKGIMKMIDETGIDPSGLRAVVVGRSNIVGKPVAKLLLDRNATVTIAHSRTKDLASVCREADILVVAVGKEHIITADMVKPGAVVIDVGINRTSEGKVTGDVDFEGAEPVAGYISPVPGGVGPMTICMLMDNTIECFKKRLSANGK